MTRTAAVLHRLLHPRTTVRWRLTLLYGGLFLVCGAALLAITYTLVAHAPVKRRPPKFVVVRESGQGVFEGTSPMAVQQRRISVPPEIGRLLKSAAGQTVVHTVGSDQRIADLHQLVIESAIALAIMAILSGALGWVVAGRVLRPLRTMTAAAHEISAASLDRRLAMDGPRDELRQLADTIDGLLARLEHAFEAQRRFVANASHELRTPLTAAGRCWRWCSPIPGPASTRSARPAARCSRRASTRSS